MSKSITDPSSVNLVIYHDKCPDGFGAAFAAWKLLGDNATYIGCDHGSSTFPDVTGKRVVILDFSFKAPTLLKMIQSAEQLLVIDHHASAVDELASIPDQYKIFDMNQSGATMAWKFFHPGKMTPQLLLYIEDRDLWRWKLNKSQEICIGLDTIPQKFSEWDNLMTPSAIQQLRFIGEAIIPYRKNLIDSIVSKSAEREFCGGMCRVVNTCGGSIVSEVGNTILAKYNVPIALMWYLDYSTKQYKVSLRSIPGVNCSEIAKRYGGGGHLQSSAFTISIASPSPQLEEFESKIIR